MKDLPTEILDIIFRLLHQKDKVECLQECRTWKCALEDTCLFSVLRLTNTTQINKMIEKIKRESNQKQRVEQLIVDMEHIDSIEIDILSLLFSNIRQVVFYEPFPPTELPITEQPSPHTWSGTIRSIRENKSHVFAYSILKGGIMPYFDRHKNMR
jgi:hypothetical protein